MTDSTRKLPAAVPTWRRLAVSAGLGVFLLCSGFDVVTGSEHWPFSPYAMYARIKEDYRSRKFYLFGVTPDGRETAMDGRDDLAPFDRVGLHTALLRLSLRKDGAAKMRELVQDAADRRARRGLRPRFDRVRLYRLVWEMDPTLANLESPKERDLIVEVAPEAAP